MSTTSQNEPSCDDCGGSGKDPAGVWDRIEGHSIDFCRTCGGSGRSLKLPPCVECGAMTAEEASVKCNCAGDKDHCHGCDLWP